MVDSADEETAPSVRRLGRVLFGCGVALQASGDFREMEDTIEYAESAGVPVPEVLAPFAAGMMLVGGTRNRTLAVPAAGDRRGRHLSGGGHPDDARLLERRPGRPKRRTTGLFR